MNRIYLSGPMTGLPELNFPAFRAEAYRLRALGYEVVNPADLPQKPDANWHDCMRNDLKALLDCDTLALLEGWQQSAGAHLEMHVAHRVGMQIVIAKDLQPKKECSCKASDMTFGKCCKAEKAPEAVQLHGEIAVFRALLDKCAAVLRVVEADDCAEAESFADLLAAIDSAKPEQPKRGDAMTAPLSRGRLEFSWAGNEATTEGRATYKLNGNRLLELDLQSFSAAKQISTALETVLHAGFAGGVHAAQALMLAAGRKLL